MNGNNSHPSRSRDSLEGWIPKGGFCLGRRPLIRGGCERLPKKTERLRRAATLADDPAMKETFLSKLREFCAIWWRCRQIKNFRFKPPADFSPDSKRKSLWNYVPAKERLELAGNDRVSPADHYLTAVNNYLKWRRQVTIGHAELPPLETMRHDFHQMVRDLIDLLGPEWVSKLCSENSQLRE